MSDRDDSRGISDALDGLRFPTDRQALLSYATMRGVEPKILQVLRVLPERRYEELQDVLDTVAQEPEGSDQAGDTGREGEPS